MGKISLKQQNSLCNALAKFVYLVRDYDNVECVCITPYDKTLELRIIIKTNSRNNKLYEDLNRLISLCFFNNKNIGYNINAFLDYSCYYNNMFDKSNNDYTAMIDLYNATILYDRSSKYGKLKNKVKSIININDNKKNFDIDMPLYNINSKRI